MFSALYRLPRASPLAFSRCFSSFRFTNSHEWVLMNSGTAKVGISQHAQDQLGDIVYVELPDVGQEFNKEEAFGCVESVKSSSSVYMPVGGKIVAVNEALVGSPELINQDAMGEGWMIEIEPFNTDTEGLLDEKEYGDMVSK